MTAPDDANDLRGLYIRQLMRKSSTLGFLAIAALLGGGIGTAVAGPALGAAAALVALLIGIGVVFWVGDSKAAEAFFKVYAEQRGLAQGGRSSLPEATPLLRKGDTRYAERTLEGQLGDGVEGTLAHYTYTVTTHNGKRTRTHYYGFTVGLIEVPECAARVPELYCQGKFGLKALERFEDAFRGSKERVELESEALDDRYEIFAGTDQDTEWLRQLFAPTFIVWLTDSAPENFAFELVGGRLCCYVRGHREKAAELDAIRAASAAVATRLREESLE